MKRVEWSDPNRVGNSECILKDDVLVSIHDKNTNTDKKISGREFKQYMLETYGTDKVTYEHNEPDFEPFERVIAASDFKDFYFGRYGKDIEVYNDVQGHVKVDRMETVRDGKEGTFVTAAKLIAEQLGPGVSEQDVNSYMKARNLTWHEVGDRRTIRIVPTEINQVFAHTGGIGIQKDMDAFSTRFESIVGRDFRLFRSPSTVSVVVDSSKIKSIVRQIREENRKTKQEKGKHERRS